MMDNEELNQDETPSQNNRKRQAESNHTPALVLAVLLGIVVLLLYAGWNLMSDDSSNISGMNKPESTKTVDTDLIDAPTDIVEEVAIAPPPVQVETIQPAPEEVKQSEKTIDKKEEEKTKSSYSGKTGIYTIKNGDTFFAVATKFNTSVNNLKEMNPAINPDAIKVGITKVSVPVQAVHTVGPGDILRVVATKYGISVEAVMAANGKKKNHSERGEKLLIPHKKKV